MDSRRRGKTVCTGGDVVRQWSRDIASNNMVRERPPNLLDHFRLCFVLSFSTMLCMFFCCKISENMLQTYNKFVSIVFGFLLWFFRCNDTYMLFIVVQVQNLCNKHITILLQQLSDFCFDLFCCNGTCMLFICCKSTKFMLQTYNYFFSIVFRFSFWSFLLQWYMHVFYLL